MRVTYRPDPAESARGCLLVAGRQRSPFVGLILIGVLALTALMARILTPGAWLPTVVIAYCGVLLAFWAIQTEFRWRQQRRTATDSHLHEDHTLEFDAVGVRSTCSHMAALIPWSAVERVDESSEFYLFWYGPTLALPVPKRILPDDDDAALRTLVRTHARDHGAGLAHEPGVPAGAAT